MSAGADVLEYAAPSEAHAVRLGRRLAARRRTMATGAGQRGRPSSEKVTNSPPHEHALGSSCMGMATRMSGGAEVAVLALDLGDGAPLGRRAVLLLMRRRQHAVASPSPRGPLALGAHVSRDPLPSHGRR